MKIDLVKLERQKKSFELWRNGKLINGVLRYAIGIITAVTGFGKTYIMILAIKYMNENHPDRNAIVVVPTNKLLEDWIGYHSTDEQTKKKIWIPGHIEKHNIQNTRVFVVNTFVQYKDWECDFLGLDEAHRYSNQDAQFFSTVLKITKYKYLMAMTATLSKKQEEFFAQFNIPIVDKITVEEALKYGYIAPSSTYNLGIPLSEEDQKYNDDINEKFNFYFGRFNHEFELVKACAGKKDVPISIKLKNGDYLGKKTPKEWIREYARINNYNGDVKHPYSPDLIARNAAQCMSLMAQRKNKWQNFPSKIEVALKLIAKFPVKTICFSETSAFADKLAKRIPDICMSYHTNLCTIARKGNEIIEIGNQEEKEELKELGYEILGKAKRLKLAMSEFSNPNSKIRVLSTVRAVDEGVDVPEVEFTLQLAYTSTARQDTQRNGRGGRLDYNNLEKKALNITLYMMGTQEEKWVKEKQKEGGRVNWVDSIDDISMDKVINLTTRLNEGEITIEKSDIISTTSRDNSQGANTQS